MKKFVATSLCILGIFGCSKHDPILPGTRHDIFGTDVVHILNQDVPNLPDNVEMIRDACPYTLDTSNVLRDGETKIFSGFATDNFVDGTRHPTCDKKFVYAGLTTGELVKVNPATRALVWTSDIYRPSNMTGGASLVDIVVAPYVVNNDVYVGGLGDAFCRVNATTGTKRWCANIGVANDFIYTTGAIFVVSTDGNLYAIRTSDGAAYWATPVKRIKTPRYQDKKIYVDKQTFDATNGHAL